jgi:hypothetical protein
VKEGLRISGDIELLQKHARSYDTVRKPLSAIAPEDIKRAAPECRYMVTGGEGKSCSPARFSLQAKRA